MTKIAAAVLGLLLLTNVSVASAWTIHMDAKIQELVVSPSGSFYIIADRDLCDDHSSANPVDEREASVGSASIPQTPAGMQSMISVALAARLSGRTVHLWLSHYYSGQGQWACLLEAMSLR